MLPSRAADHPLAPYRDSSAFDRAAAASATGTLEVAGLHRGVSVVILNLDKPELIIPLIDALAQAQPVLASAGLDLQVIIGDTGSTDPEVLAAYQQAPPVVEVVRDLKYQFSRSNNDAVRDRVRNELLVLLNNDVLLRSVEPLLALVEQFDQDPRLGAAGLVLDFPDGTLQHAGVDVFRAGELRGFCYHPGSGEAYVHTPGRSWDAVAATGAALMVRTEYFSAVGGLDEAYEKECQDVDLCLALRRLGLGVRVVDAGPLVHLENATRVRGEESWEDRRLFTRRWGSFVEATLL